MAKPKFKMIGSAPSLERLNQLVCNYFYSNISFVEISENQWRVENSKGPIEGFRVVSSKGRYRFERSES